MGQLSPPTRSAVAGELVQSLSGDQLRGVLATATGDFRHDLLTGFARSLPADAVERKAAIESLALPPEVAAQLAVIAP
jgi:hypothetical protein